METLNSKALDTPVATRIVAVPPSIDMVNLLGPRDDFLRILEERLRCDIHVRGGRISLTGDASEVGRAARSSPNSSRSSAPARA